MTRLHRTALTLCEKIQCAVKALANHEEHGVITDLSREFDLSRPTVYEVKDRACEVLKAHFEKSELAGQPVCVMVDEAQLQRTIVALRAMSPNALSAIEDMLPIIYPGVAPSFGKIQSITARAEANARVFNAQADRSKIQAGALDELFSQGDPVLGGVGLDSGYLFGLSRRASRSGADWAEVLRDAQAQGLDLSMVVKDAGLGIDAGVREVFPDAERRDDGFHALYEMNKVQRQLEQKA
jgi:hypothetical protein